MKSVAEAAAEVLAAFEPLGSERVPLLAALGRFSAEPYLAREDLPAFDNSAMDGYALRSADTHAACARATLRLPISGESRAGGEPPAALAPGSAQRIFTGAPLPAGADAVELQENVRREGDALVLERALEPYQNVRRRGEDAARGALLVPVQSELAAGELALLASQDHAAVSVFRRPRVAIICCGDELREVGEPARPGAIVNSNGYGLSAQVLLAGAEPWLLPITRDVRDEVAAAVRSALAGADVLVLSGGVSVGDYDLTRAGLEAAGVTLAFWKVRMKPGKPLSFARYGRVPVLGLPGNPVSAWVTFELFARPGLRKMLGDPAPERPRLAVRLAAGLKRSPGRAEFARARLLRDEDGFWAELAPRQGSGSLPSLVGVDALVEIAPECAALERGATLSALLLRPLPR
jgi:molybdopterin molybdotransferase